jgi:hypothetical protein
MTVPVFVDFDGVINACPDGPSDLAHWPEDTWRKEHVWVAQDHIAYPINWSTCVIDRLRGIESRDDVEMIWSTTWTTRARSTLAPLIGIGHDWKVVTEFVPDGDRRLDWWKATHTYQALQLHDRVVWIDDDIDAWTSTLTSLGRNDEWKWTLDERLCCICPQTRHGLKPEDLDAIERFLNS